MTYSFLEPAQAELDEAVDYYNERQAGLGDDLATEVEEAIGRILRNPSGSPKISANTRRCRVGRFLYALIYQVRSEGILIVAVMHLRRDPQYWRSRVLSSK